MIATIRAATAALLFSTAGVALAHPGHGTTPGASLLHLLAEPEHAVWIAALLAASVALLLKKARA